MSISGEPNSPSPSPEPETEPAIPWQVLDLVANNLDPKTLATAACVSKSWRAAMSSDHRWEHLCTTHFPSLTHLRSAAVPPSPPLPYNRLYNLAATATKRRQRPPSNPNLTLQDLTFVITLTTPTSTFTITRPAPVPGSDHDPDPKSNLFRFDFDVRDRNRNHEWLRFDVTDETKVTWNVVWRGFEGVFTMMDCKGKGGFVSGSDGWFSAELPAAGCCCGGGGSGMVAEMRLVMREEGGGGGGVGVGSVNVGVLSVVSWRYVSVDDGLRYLQHFLEPRKLM